MPLAARLRTRWPLLLMYVVLVAAGVVSLVAPSRLVYSLIPGWVTVVWACFFVAGGGAAAVGVVRGDWAGEVIGLPLAASACALYSGALLVQATAFSGRVSGAVVFVALLSAAYALGLAERWLTASSLLRITRRVGDGGN